MTTPSVFPVRSSNPLQHGITKREMFAAMAMQAIISLQHTSTEVYTKDMIESAVCYADGLMKALESQQ